MPGLIRSIFGLLLTFVVLSAYAESTMHVAAMHYPAWLVRNHQTLPLEPGTTLQEGDLIRSGDGSRVQLALSGGRGIRLGESARFLIEGLPARASESNAVLTGSFRVLRGVFFAASTNPDDQGFDYELEIGIGEISATLESADVWGRVSPEQDALCLMAGEINLGITAAESMRLNQALSCLVKPRNQPPLPVDVIDLRQHQLWIAETELKSERGLVIADGQWQLVLISLTDAKRAEQVLADFRQQGCAARSKTVLRQGRTLHRLLLPGFESIDAARNAASRIEQTLGISDAWVWKQPDS